MTPSATKNWDVAKEEYSNALGLFRHFSGLRRQDMAFVTTVQAAILTIIGSKLLSLDFSSFLLSSIAFFVLLLGLNSERRLAAHMFGEMLRARQIEAEHGMALLSVAYSEVENRKLLMKNNLVFPLYYFIFIVAWVIIWILNLRK
ncbi:MAG TPA: hypothetical protein VGV59_10045 [Pyrinomonadaceae bacterium]|nr:hypothetical protein [Pyrinomonadaceae bacterium]